jgi:uncharacterized damage-inducible protein DinB
MPASLKALALGDLEQELATTRSALERIPDEHLAWKPHEKSFSLGALGAHLANLPMWMTMTLAENGFDLASAPPPRSEPGSKAEILAAFDAHVADLRERVAGATDAILGEDWTLRNGDDVMWTRPKGGVFRTFGISHLVHHRAQLGVYLRQLDVPVPSAYGPTADEAVGL